MQTARMLEPKERTIGGKLIEMFRAVQIELRRYEVLRLMKREVFTAEDTTGPTRRTR